MQELSLKELKEIEFKILQSFVAFCKENNLRYMLAYGTLLGAIRYKGFIPWDDDVDVMMPREDYNKLLAIYKDSDQYRLFAYEKDANVPFPYAKICDMTTRKEEFDYISTIPLGVDLDIFPLDYWDNDTQKAKREARVISRNRFFLGLSLLRKPDSHNPIKRLFKGVLMGYCKMRGSAYFVDRIIREAAKESQRGSQYMGTKTWCVYGERNIIPAEVFAETIDIEFEGATLLAPIDYDTYLTCLYGDYLPEPPKEKQKTHHRFHAYRL